MTFLKFCDFAHVYFVPHALAPCILCWDSIFIHNTFSNIQSFPFHSHFFVPLFALLLDSFLRPYNLLFSVAFEHWTMLCTLLSILLDTLQHAPFWHAMLQKSAQNVPVAAWQHLASWILAIFLKRPKGIHSPFPDDSWKHFCRLQTKRFRKLFRKAVFHFLEELVDETMKIFTQLLLLSIHG